MKPSRALMKARELIENPADWWDGKGDVGTRPKGTNCAATALGQICDRLNATNPLLYKMATTLPYLTQAADVLRPRMRTREGFSIITLNDKYGHAAVIDAYQLAASMALSDEAGQ